MNTNRKDAPFSEYVVPYFKTHANNVHLNIYCGPEGIKKAEQDANDYRNHGYTPSLCLLESDDYKNYWWPVKALTIVLNWNCENIEMQIEFSNYLVNVCQAHQVFTLLDGVSTKFMNASKVKITNRMAA